MVGVSTPVVRGDDRQASERLYGNRSLRWRIAESARRVAASARLFSLRGSSPNLHGRYLSEIWLREEEDEFLAMRIDWLGHARHAPQAHYHFEAFPSSQRFNYEHRAGKVMVTKFDPLTGLRTGVDPHAPLIRDDR
jgi:hypothetical protein